MEYVRGETLRGWLAQKERSWRDVLALLCEAGQGLAAAHAAGLIHRDFKPENVLVGDDGRPRVGDFGLARVGPAPSIPVVSVELAETALTQAGTVLGTPAYMAPEQLGGDTVDARCDQFAFCVVAWECLYGKRPFAGIDRQTRAEPPRTDVPLRVRRVIERGLAVAPAQRYADMPALIAALRKAARPKTKQWIATVLLGTAVLGAAGYVGVGAWKHREQEAACALEGSRVAAVVGPEQQIAVRLRFLATRSPMADSAYEHAMAVLDPYAHMLAARTMTTCLAPTEPLHDARAQCLASRANRLADLTQLFATADAATVSRAASSAWSVAELDPCADQDALQAQRKRRPVDPESRRALDEVFALRDAGKYEAELTAATALLARARAAKDRDSELDALLAVAMAQKELEKPEAGKSFDEVSALAETLGRDVDAASAYASMAANAARDQQDFKAAHRYLALARAKLDRVGGKNLSIRGDLFVTEAKIFMDEYRFPEGEASGRQGVALLEQALGANNPKVGIATGTLSQLLRGTGKQQEALAMSERTLDIFEKAFGEGHPTTAGASLNLAQSLIEAKRYDEARQRLLRADVLFERVFGPVHPVHVAIWSNLGTIEQLQEHWDASLGYNRRVLAMLEQIAGPESADASGAHRDIAKVLSLSNHPVEAEAEQQRAVAILEKLGADGEGRMLGAQIELAEIQLMLKRTPLARASLQRALSIAATNPAVADPEEVKRAQALLAYAEGRGPAPK
jgi:tetratricopeptide (TPR) repeat protein